MRALAQAYQQWERAAGTPAQTRNPKIPPVGRHLSLPIHVEAEFADRARRRLARRDDADIIVARHAQLKEEHPVTASLNLVLAGIHEELTRIRALLEPSTAHEVDEHTTARGDT